MASLRSWTKKGGLRLPGLPWLMATAADARDDEGTLSMRDCKERPIRQYTSVLAMQKQHAHVTVNMYIIRTWYIYYASYDIVVFPHPSLPGDVYFRRNRSDAASARSDGGNVSNPFLTAPASAFTHLQRG